jgi:DNA-binding IclR family transcriptional regulator
MDAKLSAARRALALVELIATRRVGLSFTELGEALRLSPASLNRLLKSLLDEGWIRQHETGGLYVVGHRLLGLGHTVRAQIPDPDVVGRVIATLAHDTGHSACFATFQQNFFMLVAKTETGSAYHFMDAFARNYDWIDNAMGQFLLSFQPVETMAEIYRQHFEIEVSEADLAAFEKIRRDRFLCRVDGVVTRVIASVEKPGGGPIENLVSIAALGSPLDLSALERQVRRAAAEAERRLGLVRTPEPAGTRREHAVYINGS